jgi:hypothetical protein
MPAGGFGNLIALPLQCLPRKSGNSVFINEHFQPYLDQWGYLASVLKVSAKHLYECLEKSEYHSHKSTMGNTSIAYRWYQDIPLNKDSNTKVTVVKAFTISKDKDGKQKSTIAGVWATNLDVDKSNIAQITKAARARWRIENQCFNTLKNFGYELTHNWGHLKGESFNFYILIMLAFYRLFLIPCWSEI